MTRDTSTSLLLTVAGLLPWVALVVAPPLAALDPARPVRQYSLTSWQTDEGLPQNTVRDLAQTADGYLWVGTQAGLVRFDGARFEVLGRTTHPEVFQNQHIYSLAVDRDDTLWIGTNGGGLVRHHAGELERLDLALPTGRITDLAPAADGTLWIGTYGGGLARLDPGGRLEVLDSGRGLGGDVIFDVTLDPGGRPWIASYGGGVSVWTGTDFEVYDRASGTLPVDQAWAVLPTERGVWIGTDAGLVHLADGRTKLYTRADGLPHDRCISLLRDRDGNLWIGTYGGGLVRFDGQHFETLDHSNGLGSDSIWSLFEDREGLLWAGTLGGGLNRLKNGAFDTLGLESGLPSTLSSTLVEDIDGSFWVGSRGAGLSRMVGRRFTPDPTYPADGVWAILRDRAGTLWTGTSGRGLARRTDGEGWEVFGPEHHPLLSGSVFTLIEDPGGGLWIGTNEGLLFWNDKGFETFGRAEGLASEQIRAFVLGPEGGLYVGTTGGLSHRPASGGPFRSYTAADGLPSENIWSLTWGAEDALWLGTYGGGLARFRAGRFDAWTTAAGLPDDDVTSVVRDDLGCLWLGGSRGVFRVLEEEVARWMDEGGPSPAFGVYGRHDGIRSDGGGLPIGLRARDGRVWFAHFGGVSVIDPATVQPIPAPAVLLERAEVATGPIPVDEPLRSDTRGYHFHFTAPTLTVPEKIAFRYRLLGFDDDWIETETREATYSFLEPGDYVFEVMASDETRRWTGPVARRSFRVAPSFVRTPAFLGLCALVFGLVSLAVHRWRVVRFEHREQELAVRVDEALTRVKTLRGLLPMCSSCKSIRDDAGYWQELEAYLESHSDAALSHGLCPPCTAEYYPDLVERAHERVVSVDS